MTCAVSERAARSCRRALAPAIVALALAAARPAPAAPAESPFHRIAVAEDERRWDATLRDALADRSAAVRARAALAVGRLQDSTSVPALLPLLADASPEVRREAAFALGQIGHRSARPALERALADRDAETVELAIEALGKLGDPSATRALLPMLDARAGAWRARACESLWRLADTSAVGALIAHLGDPDPAVRWRVVYALEKLPLPARIVPAAERLLHDPDPLVRAHAARTLGREKSPLAGDALVAALGDPDPAVIVNAIRSLQGIADSTSPRTLPILVHLLRAHPSPAVRVTAATALADRFAWMPAPQADHDDAVTALRAGLEDRDPATRGACARALIARHGLAAFPLATPLLRDSIVYVRAAVLDGVRALPDTEVASQAKRVAGILGNAMAADLPGLERMTAIEIAGQLAGRSKAQAFETLHDRVRAGLDDADVLVAATCAGALADWGDTAAVPGLARAYAARGRDADADARLAIRDALRALAGRAFADSVERANPATARPPAYDTDFGTPPRETRAVIHTGAGDMTWRFDAAVAPQTVRNFVRLAKRGYFDGLRVHRVVPDFVIQDGDPTGTGSGGPGWTIRCEYNRLRYEAGMVGMALSGKDTGGSQWFVTLSPQPHLNGRYTIFAHVIAGLDVAKRVTQGTIVRRVEILP